MRFGLPRLILSGGLCVVLLVAGDVVAPGHAASVQTDFHHFVSDVGVAASVVPYDHRRSAPASPWSTGVSGSAVKVPDRGYVDRLYGNEDPPDYLYVPRVHLARRLGTDILASGFLSQDPENDLRIVGGTLGWSFRPAARGFPRFTLRAVGTRTSAQRDYVIQGVTVEDFRVRTYGADGILAYDGTISPYFGYGVLEVEGDATARTGAETLREVTATEDRGFAGISTRMSSVRLSLQVDAGSVWILTAGLSVVF